jgi:hypothetical protein
MKLGLFMMPLHDPNRDYTKPVTTVKPFTGGEVAMRGGSGSATALRLSPSPIPVHGDADPVTKSISSHQRAQSAAASPGAGRRNRAMFDHLCGGRFVMGIGPRARPTSSVQGNDKDRRR